VENEAMQQRVRNRQETVNKRFKKLSSLNERFHNPVQKPANVFRAVGVVTGISIQQAEPVFDVDYDDDLL
jgi:hypothetical protein